MAAKQEILRRYDQKAIDFIFTNMAAKQEILRQKPDVKSINSLEIPKKIFQIEPEAKTELKEKFGLEIHTLTGKSIKDLRKEGLAFQSTWHKNYPYFEGRKSITSEIAIVPTIFLPGSNNKSRSEHKEMVADYDQEVRKEVKGVKAIIGKAADNTELIYKLSKGTNGNKDLLKEASARSADDSPISSIYGKGGHLGVTVGHMDPEKGMLVTGYDNGSGRPGVHVIALLVPEDLPQEEPTK